MSIDIINENRYNLKGKKQTKTVTDIDYADDLALLANTPAREVFLLHNLEQAANGMGVDDKMVKLSLFNNHKKDTL